MDDVFLAIGRIFCIIGGVLVAGAILTMIGYFVVFLWIDLSDRFRSILKAENLIIEYKKYKTEFMEWWKEKHGGKIYE